MISLLLSKYSNAYFEALLYCGKKKIVVTAYAYIAGLSNMQPTGCMRPARQYCVAREVICILIVLAELMK